MVQTLKATARQFLTAVRTMQSRGYGLLPALLVHLPVAATQRIYWKLARSINGRLINAAFNYLKFRAFQDKHADRLGGHFYVIVMPRTLHFLLPCLDLLSGKVSVLLLGNGARAWEREFLQAKYPDMPFFELRTLPGSSVAHGDVISLLLANNDSNFGILDHDCYAFDPKVFAQLDPGARESMLGVFPGFSSKTGIFYPETYFLFFHTKLLRELMQRHRVDAGWYRQAPASAAAQLERIGLGPHMFLKDHHNFFDTLHVLLALALSEGMAVRFLGTPRELSVFHVGGTSGGTTQTKSLPELYMHLRFLELADSAILNARYAYLTFPLRSSAELRRRLPQTPEVMHMLQISDELIRRLRQHQPQNPAA
ncbi:MAG: hypothetical protein H0T80_01725 [Betaproteobacteria bacterium]|nr:hypothetical protein [Betaproteobacteria bacterium]